jgi:hypothetical protein
MTMVLSVAALDDLLGETIALLRSLGIDRSNPNRAQTGVSSKLTHLVREGGLSVGAADVRVHELCVALRNAVTHHGGSQRAVAAAWRRLAPVEQSWWTAAAGRHLPLTGDDERLSVDDREMIATLKASDRVALAVNEALRVRVPEADWIRMVFAEYRALVPYRAGDRNLRAPLIVGHARHWWRLSFRADRVRDVLDQ